MYCLDEHNFCSQFYLINSIISLTYVHKSKYTSKRPNLSDLITESISDITFHLQMNEPEICLNI